MSLTFNPTEDEKIRRRARIGGLLEEAERNLVAARSDVDRTAAEASTRDDVKLIKALENLTQKEGLVNLLQRLHAQYAPS